MAFQYRAGSGPHIVCYRWILLHHGPGGPGKNQKSRGFNNLDRDWLNIDNVDKWDYRIVERYSRIKN